MDTDKSFFYLNTKACDTSIADDGIKNMVQNRGKQDQRRLQNLTDA